MRHSTIPGTVEPADGPPPPSRLAWDTETEILTCHVPDLRGTRGLTGSIELGDERGSVVTLDFAGGLLRGVEIVVWPPSEVRAGLAAPRPSGHARLFVPARPSQPGMAVVEFDTRLAVERSGDDRLIHLSVGGRRGSAAVALADRLLLELDQHDAPCGFWFLDVPPFPVGDRS
jgi:hypothetical protein